MEPILVSVNGAAEALNLGRTSIYALINEGRLQTVKLGISCHWYHLLV